MDSHSQSDARAPQAEPPRWRVSDEVESLTWNPHEPTCFVVSSEDGVVAHFDARKGAGGLPRIAAGCMGPEAGAVAWGRGAVQRLCAVLTTHWTRRASRACQLAGQGPRGLWQARGARDLL
jgi:hypothetical protein